MQAKDEILPEYDFSNGERGKYYEDHPNSNIRCIDQDLVSKFPTSETVNQALRGYLKTHLKP